MEELCVVCSSADGCIDVHDASQKDGFMVSIIIPVYNTGKVLNKCLRSVLEQTYVDWECIVVNDASTDVVTNRILQEWKERKHNFVFIEKTVNEGVDLARFSAISIAKGDYIIFVDSDDWLEPETLGVMVDKSQETDADIVMGQMRKIYLGGLFKKSGIKQLDWMGRVITHDELMKKYYKSFFGLNIFPVNIWAVLYKRSLFGISNIAPSKLKFGEDQVMMMRLFPYIHRFYAIDKIVYNYRIGLPGLSDKYLNSWLENARRLYELKMSVLDETKDEELIFYQKIELVNFIKSYVNVCMRYRKNRRQENIEHLQRELLNPIYKSLQSLIGTRYSDKESVNLLIKGDAHGFYVQMEQRYKSLPIKHKIIDSCFRFLWRFRKKSL